MAGIITGETKREGHRKAKRQNSPPEPKKQGRELVPQVRGSYLTHDLLMLLECKS